MAKILIFCQWSFFSNPVVPLEGQNLFGDFVQKLLSEILKMTGAITTPIFEITLPKYLSAGCFVNVNVSTAAVISEHLQCTAWLKQKLGAESSTHKSELVG